MSQEQLSQELLAMDDATLTALFAEATMEELAELQAALASVELERSIVLDPGQDWRATPATMAHHLTRGEYQLYRYIVLLGERIRAAFDGVDPHQQFWLPSQYGKTTCVANWTPVWALDRDPRTRIMYISYDANKAVEEAGKARDLVAQYSKFLRVQLRKDRRARGMWSTPQGGGLYAVGINGGIVGWPADAILMDDLLKGWRDAHSPTIRRAAFEIYRSQIRMRAQSFTTPIISAGTRWHEDDVQARMVKLGRDEPAADQWVVTRLPAIAEAPDPNADDPIYRQPDPLGRQPGEVLEPRRFSVQEVKARQATAGAYLAAATEQQRPAPEEGGEIKRDWWKYAQTLPPSYDDCISSWDMKLKDNESGDFVVGLICGRTGKDVWVFGMLRGQWNQPTTENAIALAAVRHRQIRRHYVENTGNGPEVMASIRRAMPDYVVSDEIAGALGMTEEEREKVQQLRRRGIGRVLPNNPKGSKEVRMRGVSGMIEAGDVHLFEAPWNSIFVGEHAAFPNGAHDDIVDACSQALSKITTTQATASSTRSQLPPTPVVSKAGPGTRLPPAARVSRAAGRVVSPIRSR